MGKPECRLDHITGRMDYFGGMINRAARISGIAFGGQILASSKVWEAVKKEVHNVEVIPFGEHFLKGLKSPEWVIQILPKTVCNVLYRYVALLILCAAEISSTDNEQRKSTRLAGTKQVS